MIVSVDEWDVPLHLLLEIGIELDLIPGAAEEYTYRPAFLCSHESEQWRIVLNGVGGENGQSDHGVEQDSKDAKSFFAALRDVNGSSVLKSGDQGGLVMALRMANFNSEVRSSMGRSSKEAKPKSALQSIKMDLASLSGWRYATMGFPESRSWKIFEAL